MPPTDATPPEGSLRFVAVTACPTGIARSQMAAERLRDAAAEAGHELRVEIRGAMGTKDELTPAEIGAADAAIVAADTDVDDDRFAELPVLRVPVGDAVTDARGLVAEASAAARAKRAEGGANGESRSDDAPSGPAGGGSDDAPSSAARDEESAAARSGSDAEPASNGRDHVVVRLLRRLFG